MASIRTALAVGGLLFSTGALILACLDYAGESAEGCGAVAVDAGSTADACAEAAAPVPTGGSGSGS